MFKKIEEELKEKQRIQFRTKMRELLFALGFSEAEVDSKMKFSCVSILSFMKSGNEKFDAKVEQLLGIALELDV